MFSRQILLFLLFNSKLGSTRIIIIGTTSAVQCRANTVDGVGNPI